MGTAFHHIRSGSGLRREQYIIGCSLEIHRQQFGHKWYWPKVLDVHSSIQELVDRIRSARIVHTIPNVIETMRRPQRPPVQQDEVHDFSSHVLLGGRGFGLVDEQQGISFEMMDDEPALSTLEGSETLVLYLDCGDICCLVALYRSHMDLVPPGRIVLTLLCLYCHCISHQVDICICLKE